MRILGKSVMMKIRDARNRVAIAARRRLKAMIDISATSWKGVRAGGDQKRAWGV